MKFLKIVFGLVLGYIAGAAIGAGLVDIASTNTHDKAQELATTALLITGPIGAVLGLIAGIVSALRSQPKRSSLEPN